MTIFILSALLSAQPAGALRPAMLPLSILICPRGEPQFVEREGYTIVVCRTAEVQ